ncbi:MAG: PCMD domain-containing protein, partial [Bacteroidia bacterium]
MQKLFTFLFLASFSFVVFGQTPLPNGDFETWQSSGNYENPSPTNFWTTLNAIATLNPAAVTVSKSTDVVSGTYAAKIETKVVGTLVVAGIITTGTFSLATQSLKAGKPFTDKPSNLTGFYKYTSVNGDSFTIAIELSKWMNNQHTILGGSFIEGNQSVTSYTPFDLVCDYSNFPNETPDTLTVTFTSSAGGANFQGAAGSTLWIDGVELKYNPVSTTEKANATFATLFPNPASDNLTIQLAEQNTKAVFTLYNQAGQKMQVANISDLETAISLSNVAKGLYLYELVNEKGEK